MNCFLLTNHIFYVGGCEGDVSGVPQFFNHKLCHFFFSTISEALQLFFRYFLGKIFSKLRIRIRVKKAASFMYHKVDVCVSLIS